MADLLQVFGDKISQPSRSVTIFLKFSKVPFKFIHKNLLKLENMSEDFEKINPFQEVPAIVHNSFAVWESASIIPYLADAYNIDNMLYPKNIEIRARINAYLHWHHKNIRAPLVEYVRAKLLIPRLGGPKLSTEEESKFQKGVKETLETIAWILKDNEFIGRTPHATIADVFAYTEIATALAIPINLSIYPSVQTWFTKIGQIPAVKEEHEFMFKLRKTVPKL